MSYYGRPSSLTDVTFQELSEKTKIPVDLLLLIREAVGFAEPRPWDRVRENGAVFPSGSPSFFSVPKRTKVIRRLSPVTTPPALRESGAYDLGEDDCIVVVPIMGGVDGGECTVTCPAPALFEPRPLVTKFVKIAAAEFLEASRVVPEPSS